MSAAPWLRVRAPAKLNLSLLVLHKRLDNFHELRTVFQTIDLSDTLEIQFRKTRQSKIHLDSATDIPNNLVVRAADLFLSRTGLQAEINFRLTKRIPMGGGLGGGSSDAAAALLALCAASGRWPDSIEEMAADLGSDVPFFLMGGSALGLGRGEELYPLPDLGSTPVLLACPGIHVPTPPAFQALARKPLTELTSPDVHNRMKEFQSLVAGVVCPLAGFNWMSIAVNDFEAAVFPQFPQLSVLRQALFNRGARLARMSGSGSTLFGLFDSVAARDRATRQLTKDHPNVQWAPTRFLSRVRFRRQWRTALSSIQRRSRSCPEKFGWIA